MNVWASDKLVLCAAYTLVAMAKLAFPAESMNASTHRLQQLTTNAKDSVFKKAAIPLKYWPLLRQLDKIHDTVVNMCFANLQCSMFLPGMRWRRSR